MATAASPNNLSPGTYAQRTARDPVSVSGKPPKPPKTKEAVEVKTSRGINLLSDTGLALKRAVAKYWLTRVSLIVMGGSVLFTAGTFGFWFIADRQQVAIQNQISVLEQRLATMSDVESLIVAYKSRLQTISKLINTDQPIHKPGNLEQEVDSLATSVEGVMTTFEYGSNSVKGTIEVKDVGDVDKVLRDLQRREQEGLWSNVVISKFSRQKPEVYGVEFTASLAVTPSGTPSAQPAKSS